MPREKSFGLIILGERASLNWNQAGNLPMDPVDLKRLADQLDRQERLLDELRGQHASKDSFRWWRIGELVRFSVIALTVLTAGSLGFVAGDLSDADKAQPALQQSEMREGQRLVMAPPGDVVDLEDISAALACPERILGDIKPTGPVDIFLIDETRSAGLVQANYGVLALGDTPPHSADKGYHYLCNVDLLAGSSNVVGFEVPLEGLLAQRPD